MGGPPVGGGIVIDPLAGGGGIIDAGGPAATAGTDDAVAMGAPVAVEKNTGRPTGALVATAGLNGFALDGGGIEFGGLDPG